MAYLIAPEPVNHFSPATGATFCEAQHFHQIWLWILLGGLAALSWSVLILYLPSLDPVTTIIVVFPLWFYVMKLAVKFDGILLLYRMYPPSYAGKSSVSVR